MSLSTFKKKSVVISGSNISGKGVFGFSLNGNVRNNTYVGKTSLMSSAGTPMKGQYPYGYGGCCGTYPTYIMYNVYPDSALGNTSIVPQNTVLTTRGMLEQRYACIYNGTYPNNVVKNVYTGDLTDNASQGVYIDKVVSSNSCIRDTFKIKVSSSIGDRCLLASGSTRIYPGTDIGGYTKPPIGATDSSTYLQYIKRNCTNKDTHIPKPFYVGRSC
jgi:hypothetical protein